MSLAVEFRFDSPWGRVAITGLIVVALAFVSWLVGRTVGRAFEDPQQSYNARRLMEIGSAGATTWVQGRQYTGRVVTVSNKASLTEPVYNYSSYFEYI